MVDFEHSEFRHILYIVIIILLVIYLPRHLYVQNRTATVNGVVIL